MPALSAAWTTSAVSWRPMRPPKLLQPTPTTLTASEPIRRVSTVRSLPVGPPSRQDRVGSTVPATREERTATRRGEETAMAAGAVDVTLTATPDAAWKVVGDFGGVADFFPGIESFRLEGDDRIIGMFGMEIRERLLARDEDAMTISY